MGIIGSLESYHGPHQSWGSQPSIVKNDRDVLAPQNDIFSTQRTGYQRPPQHLRVGARKHRPIIHWPTVSKAFAHNKVLSQRSKNLPSDQTAHYRLPLSRAFSPSKQTFIHGPDFLDLLKFLKMKTEPTARNSTETLIIRILSMAQFNQYARISNQTYSRPEFWPPAVVLP